MNKNYIVTLALLTAMNVAAGVGVFTLGDNYTTRGIVCNNELVLQGLFDTPLGTNGFNLLVWENTDLTDKFGNKNDVTELDIIPRWTKTIGDDAFDIGAAQYTFPNTEYDATYEVYLKYTAPLWYATVFYDVDEVNSWYGQAGVTPTKQITQNLSTKTTISIAAAGAGYNEFYFLDNSLAWNDLVAKQSLIYSYKNLQLVGDIGYSFLIDEKISDGAKELYGQSDTKILNLSLVVVF